MARDEREEEREFLAELKTRSGRDLAAWMAAIAAQSFADKNETIDWLRRQGFPFARASWLERIHSNGGRPIYEQAAARKADAAPIPHGPPARAAPAPQAQKALSGEEAAQYDKLLAAAKGYRPLYLLLEGEIRRTIPGVSILPRPSYLSIGAPKEFAAVSLHAGEVRLGLDLGEHPFDAGLLKAKLKGPGAAISHMVVLTDARQVNHTLMALLTAACARVNS